VSFPSLSKFIKIGSPPPGPRAKKIVEDTKAILSSSISRFYPLVIESAHDCIVRDVDGNEFIDFNSGLVVLNVGSTRNEVVEAAKHQLEKFTHFSYTDFYYENIVRLAEKLNEITPGQKPKNVFYGNSGTEAIEAAIKLVRYYTKRSRLLAYTGAFHGRTMGSVSLTASKPVQVKGFGPLLPMVDHVPYPYCYRCPFNLTYPECGIYCIDYIEEQYFQKNVPPDEVAALFFEPIQGEGGYVVPPEDYFGKLKKILSPYDILLVDDEVQSGIGRTGKWFAIEHFGIEPDVFCIAKALSGGLPMGATIARKEIMNWAPGSHASTFGGNPVSAAAALAVIEVIKREKLLENAVKQGAYIMSRFEEMKEKYEVVGDVRGKGLMVGIEIVKNKKTKAFGDEEAKEIVELTWKKGVLLITAGRSTLRIAPPLTISRDLIDEALPIIEESIAHVNSKSKSK
jgi:4-aminobutyrate aminotransferase